VSFINPIPVGRKMGEIRSKTIKITDHRVRLMNDILQAIKLVKLYCWEENFHQQVTDVRISHP
jgi:hypothetical protein